MIQNLEWRRAFLTYVLPRLSHAHADLTRIAQKLRASGTVEVWTESPTDSSRVTAGMEVYSLEGWRMNYSRERQSLAAFNADHGAKLQAYDVDGKAALDGYLVSIASLGPVFNGTLNNYKDQSGRVIQVAISQADRNALALAIEAELQA